MAHQECETSWNLGILPLYTRPVPVPVVGENGMALGRCMAND